MLLHQHARRQRLPVSPGSTGTAAWARIGPSSSASVTRCTVQPCSSDAGGERARVGVQARETPAAGSGWMFSIRPGQRADQERRQQPHVAGEADELDPGGRSAASIAASCAARSPPKRAVVDRARRHAGGRGQRQARPRPAGWTATSAISAG